MKAKLKGANGFVRFLLQHGEKLGMAAVLSVAALLIWSSLGRPAIETSKQPPELQTKANQAKAHVEQMSWDGFPPEDKTDWSTFKARSGEVAIKPVSPDQYPPNAHWNPLVLEPVMQRLDPVLVTVSDLEVTSGAGLWMEGDPEVIRRKMIELAQAAARAQREADEEARRMAEEAEDERGGRGGRRGPGGRGEGGFGGEGGGYGGMGDMSGVKTKDGALVVPPTGGAQMQGIEDIREKAWVTVLAKIPIKQQFQMYADALATARAFNPSVDQPVYMGYLVERAEVTDAGTGKYVQLPAVHESALTKKMATWPIQTPDAINPKYNHPLLTHPLPPMVMRTWGEEVTHSDLPIPTPEDLMAEQMEATETPLPEEEQDPSDPFGRAAAARRNQAGNMGGPEMGMPRGDMNYGGRPAMRGMGRGMMPGMMGGMEGGRGMSMGGGMGSDGTIDLPDYSWDGLTKQLLFRFFDDTVQPGHRYRYRVRLVLVDVNAQQPEQYLDPEVSIRISKEKEATAKDNKPGKARGYRMTDWSEPSPVAVVPQPGLVYIAQTKDVFSAEPEARMIVKSVDSVHAAEIGLQSWFPRGSVLNLSQRAQIIWSSLYKVDPAKPVDSPVFNFLTGLTLVDFDGGDQLTQKNRTLTAPSRVLVMDSSGRLSFQNELDAGTTILEYDYMMKQSEEAARRAREQGNERGPGRGRR